MKRIRATLAGLFLGLATLAAQPAHGEIEGEAVPEAAELLAQAPAPAPAPQPAPAQPSDVDETALRYFARQGDTRRVEAEIARLRLLYPDWEPPENLLGDDYTPDPGIERIWELYSGGDFAGVRAAIAEKQAADPGWMPTEDMLRSLELGEGALRMRNASEAGQYEAVISIAANMPDLLVCANVDLLWRLADAFIETGNAQRALDAYSYVLSNCENPAERFTTLQQASERLDRPALDTLLALERMDPDGVGEFEPLRRDLARNAIAAVLAGQSGQADPADIRRIEAAIAAEGSAEDMRLLGWYALNRNRPTEALAWFEQAMDADPSLLSVNGLGTALLGARRPEEAEAVLADYIGETEEMTALYLAAGAALLASTPRIELEPAVLERIADTAYRQQDVETAEEMGWYALAFTQPRTALAWFETALGWDPAHEPSAYGIVVAADRLDDTARINEIKRLWQGRSDRIARFGTSAALDTEPVRQASTQAQPASAAPAATTPAAPTQATTTQATTQATTITVTYEGCSSYLPPQNLSPAQALTRGWCLMNQQRPAEAVETFGRALQSSAQATRSDAAYGQALAYLRMGLPEHASVAAAAAPLSQARVVELQTAILTRTALSAYETGDYARALMALDERRRYAPERNDLLVIRAWSYYHLRRYAEAEQIFSAVAATGHGDAAAGLAAVGTVFPR